MVSSELQGSFTGAGNLNPPWIYLERWFSKVDATVHLEERGGDGRIKISSFAKAFYEIMIFPSESTGFPPMLSQV
jgi:hypothetical protein